jgi:hypothetical protein
LWWSCEKLEVSNDERLKLYMLQSGAGLLCVKHIVQFNLIASCAVNFVDINTANVECCYVFLVSCTGGAPECVLTK